MKSNELSDAALGRIICGLNEHLGSPDSDGGGSPRPGLSRYELGETLGEGGSGVVYRAWDRELRRAVAVKVMKHDLATHPGLLRRFEREVTAMSNVTHPNVATVYDVGEVDGRPTLVMELVEGRPLARICPDGRTELRALVEILEKVGRGVGVAHALGIVHRDLKPSNILVDPGGEPRVVDFGLAHVAAPDAAATQTLAAGTPPYMAPEQVEPRRGSLTPRTDVYGLGAILYQLLTGRPPHVGTSPSEIFRSILDGTPVPPRRLQPRVPRDLATIALKALDADPARRYADGRAFAEDLQRWRQGLPVEARAPSWWYRLWRLFLRRYRLATTVLVPLLVLGLVAFSRVREENDRDARRRGALASARRFESEGALVPARDAFLRVLDIDADDAAALSGVRRLDHALARRERLRSSRLARERQARLRHMREISRIALRAALDLRRAGRPSRVPVYAAEVESVCRAVMQECPELGEPHYRLGCLYRALGRTDAADRELDQALMKDPGHDAARQERALLTIARLLRHVEHRSAASRREEVWSSLGRWFRGQRREAPWNAYADDIAHALARDARAELARVSTPIARGLVAWLDGRRPEARRQLVSAVETAVARQARGGPPPASELYEWLGRIAREERDPTAAIRWYTEGHERDRGYAPLLLGRAHAQWESAFAVQPTGLGYTQEHHDAIVGDLEAIVSRDANDAGAWRFLGRAHLLRGTRRRRERKDDPRPALLEAIAAYDRALEIEATHDVTWYGRALAHAEIAEFETRAGAPDLPYARAVADLDRAIERAPGRCAYRALRGTIKLRWYRHARKQGQPVANRLDAAQADLTQALRLDDSGHATWRQRAACRVEAGALAAALDDIEEARKRHPGPDPRRTKLRHKCLRRMAARARRRR